MTSKYQERICKTDAAYENYCKFPNEDNWDLYLKAVVEERKALPMFLEKEQE